MLLPILAALSIAISPVSAHVWHSAAHCPFAPSAAAQGVVDDGCADAPAGPSQYPALLTRYGRNRPPWNVAGVEYRVGVPSGTPLSDWRNLSVPGVDVLDHIVRCDGTYASVPYDGIVVLDGIDFTTHGGATGVYVSAHGCRGLVISRSKFGRSGEGCTGASYYQIQNQNRGASTELVRNTFDMSGCEFAAAAIAVASGPVILHYNYFGHFQGQVLQAPDGPYTIDYRFNLIEDACWGPGNHMNFQEFGGGIAASSDLVAFNTTYQYRKTVCGGEVFQFYGNRGGGQLAAVLQNNTILALDPGDCRYLMVNCPVSYAIHGTGATRPLTKLAGPAYNRRNYFDTSGMYGAYYPGSMEGWINQSNKDMVTGRDLLPR